MNKVKICFVIICALSSSIAFAQTKIECSVDDSGMVRAPLIWQNTLGAQKANEICEKQIIRSEMQAAARAKAEMPIVADETQKAAINNTQSSGVNESVPFADGYHRAW